MRVKFSQKEQSSIKRKVNGLRVDFSTRHLENGGDGSAYGDVVESLLKKYSRQNLYDKFDQDTVYLLDDTVFLESKQGENGETDVRFYCVLSTENLLLNGPRQMASGQEMILAVDASYRYVVEKGHGLFVVKCINHAQSAKVTAYAICNKEDTNALTWIFDNFCCTGGCWRGILHKD